MDEMESKLSAILGNPQMMQQIMALAQNFNQGDPSPKQDPPAKPEGEGPFGQIDPTMLKKLSGLAGQSGIDRNQQTLLNALRPYLSHQRLTKLEQAMRAAKMAGMATAFLNPTGR